jgi:hypothetical protein
MAQEVLMLIFNMREREREGQLGAEAKSYWERASDTIFFTVPRVS